MGMDALTSQARVMICKLESLRYDVTCHRLMIKELEQAFPFVMNEDKTDCRENINTTVIYISQIQGVASILEQSLRKLEIGRNMLVDLNERMPI